MSSHISNISIKTWLFLGLTLFCRGEQPQISLLQYFQISAMLGNYIHPFILQNFGLPSVTHLTW